MPELSTSTRRPGDMMDYILLRCLKSILSRRTRLRLDCCGTGPIAVLADQVFRNWR